MVKLPGLVVATALVAVANAGGAPANGAPCRPMTLSADAAHRIVLASRARSDVWGDALLRAPSGPTYERARRYLPPLLLAGGPKQRSLTDSGVYYLAFGQPVDAGPGEVALHIADGSEIVSDRIGGPSITIGVGYGGRERYGSCLARLAPPRLRDGYRPILDTSYTDANGVRFQQESFAARVPEASALVSFVRLTVDGPDIPPGEQVRITPSETGLTAENGRLRLGTDTELFFTSGGQFDGTSLVYTVTGPQTIEIARLVRPGPSAPIAVGEGAFDRARTSVGAYWDRRLASGAMYVVPERRVMDAERNLLIQNLLMTWRYSLGNPYESFEFPESLENAAVLARYGFADEARAIVEQSLRREPHLYASWEAATRLLAVARFDQLFPDRSFGATAAVLRNAEFLERQLGTGRPSLLRRERYTADLPDVAYGLVEQTVAWEALTAIGRVWCAEGHPEAARAARAAALRFEPAVRTAVARSEVRLADGSLFVPARLLDSERPYGSIPTSVHGSYWNLVVPDALASGFFTPHSAQATRALAYLLRHGSRMLGLVRAGAYALYGHVEDASGTDEVYGLNVARFLADNDRPDLLVLSLYGALAAAMTQNTFISGEAASVVPLRGAHYRSMYLPPNSTSNAAFLETLRLMLVHETTAPDGRPIGLELAFATPREWLAPGRSIVVRQAPTVFGQLSYTIASHRRSVDVRVRVPRRDAPRLLRLRLRLPGSPPITHVDVDGAPFHRFEASSETISLDGLSGTVNILVRLGCSSRGGSGLWCH